MKKFCYLCTLFITTNLIGIEPVKQLDWQNVSGGNVQIQWKQNDKADQYLIYGADRRNSEGYLLKTTKEEAVTVDGGYPFYWVVSEKKGEFSLPSRMISPELEEAYPKNPQVKESVWNDLLPYFMPPDHPIKEQLDELFSQSRVLKNAKSMTKAGFSNANPRKWTRVIVTKHPGFEGYVFKMYLDVQRYYKNHPEWVDWIERIQGADLIREEIISRGWEDRYKVPVKYIYPLPAEPKGSKDYLCKHFILVAEDMNIYSDQENEEIWRSELIDEQFLEDFFNFVTDLGLHDCAKPANAPFSKDGRIAFVDTQDVLNWPVVYSKMTPHLAPEAKAYWKQLVKGAKKIR